MNRVVSWFQKPFRLLDSRRSRWQLVIFCGVFGCLFLMVFKPFNINTWFTNVRTPLFVILTFFSTAGMAALALSQLAIRSIFNITLTTRGSFLGWLVIEFLLISIAIHTVNIMVLGMSFFDVHEYLVTLKYTLMLLVLPYFFGIVLLLVQDQLSVVEELTIKASKPAVATNITINDENGKAVVHMPVRNILYFKSEDNYIFLYYKGDNELKKELIRTNLKKLEQDLSLQNFIRIHRSYMINIENLVAVSRTAQGYRVKMEDGSDQILSVSAKYQQAFEDRIVQKAS
ncbi:LytTR family DNA-binding domain-containing protein [Chryseolinea sp. T2]|uniref:LytR/AlgR family response regulator transcription factor n=1 Tax=Chryseolinea sp. T2 TaxID=3129255 RepID=UPI00307759C2